MYSIKTMLRRGMKNVRNMIRYAEQSKTQKNENSKPINLTFYLDYGALRREHLDTDFANRHEKFKGSLDCNLKVLLLEALIKPAQVTCNRLEM